MLTRTIATPAFGQADLSNCEREQIHLAGSIQPHGVLLLVREPELVIVQASENAASFLGLDQSIVGGGLGELPSDLADRLRPQLTHPLRSMARAVRCNIGDPPQAYDGLIHRPPDGGLVIELERAGTPVDVSHHLETALKSIMGAATLPALCDATARIFKAVVGYDRVMVYRFDEQGHGEVFSEEREPALEAYLGNRYPASDIPQIARRLYERNRIRVLYDVEYTAVPLNPQLSPIGGGRLDMSLCLLRSISPIHVQYLKNMGVRATLVVSLMVNGRLWGLVSCHHYIPRFIHFEARAVCELLAEAVGTRIAALESFAQVQAELSVRRLEQRMIRAISREGDWRGALFDHSKALLEPIGATGAALLFEGEVRTVGEVPGTSTLREIGTWLDRQPRAALVTTASLGDDAPQFVPITPIASGLLAVPVSTTPGEYLVWLRPERVRTVTWGGNPFAPPTVGDDATSLSPRRSFAQWHQLVEGTADPWSTADLAAARLIGDTVADVVIQFRAVRLLIAEDQRDQVRRQVHQSGHPVVVADASGRIIHLNGAFSGLLPRSAKRPHGVADLAQLFVESAELRLGLQNLVKARRAWRGEVLMNRPGGTQMPLLLRADPVVASQGRSLGSVLTFTDLTERESADIARRRFQEAVIERSRPVSSLLDSKADLAFRDLLTTIVENAQLAVLEIADGVDPARMPEMLEAIRVSVTRTTEVLSHLILHTTGTGKVSS